MLELYVKNVIPIINLRWGIPVESRRPGILVLKCYPHDFVIDYNYNLVISYSLPIRSDVTFA
jgi:hypothetical protein